MTVEELIAVLQKRDPKAMAVVYRQGGGFDPVCDAAPRHAIQAVGGQVRGLYRDRDEALGDMMPRHESVVTAVVIR